MSHFKLETKLARKCEVFSIYVAILNNRKTLENSRIRTRLSIANVCRDLTLLQLLSIAIFYRFKTTIEFLSISIIENAIINCVIWESLTIVRELRLLFDNSTQYQKLIDKTRERATCLIKTLWNEIKEIEQEVFEKNFWTIFIERERLITIVSHQSNAKYNIKFPKYIYR